MGTNKKKMDGKCNLNLSVFELKSGRLNESNKVVSINRCELTFSNNFYL